ncbi:BRCT domain [Trinorchestia longiramus]|nr:BRCT domain [Trinorchestia longiramus]
MDIRNYFPVISHKQKKDDLRENSSPVKPQATKKKKRILDSDDEDPVPPKKKVQTIVLSDSDDDIFTNSKHGDGGCRTAHKKKTVKSPVKKATSKTTKREKSPPKLKPVSASSFFSSASVKRGISSDDKSSNTAAKRKACDLVAKEDEDESPFPKTMKSECENGSETLSKKLSKISKSDKSCTRSAKSTQFFEGGEKLKSNYREGNLATTNDKFGTKGDHDNAVSSNCADKKGVVKEEKIVRKESEFSPPKPNENNPPNRKALKSYNIPKVKNKDTDNDCDVANKSKNSSKIECSKFPTKEISQSSSSSKKRQKDRPSKTSKNYTLEIEPLSPTKKKNATVKQEAASPGPSLDSSSVASPDRSLVEEKKKQNVIAYRKFLQRSGPRNPGSKVVPEGAPGCLTGLSFVLSGVLESLDRPEVTEIIQRYGGRVVGSISKKTTHLLVGDEPGGSKTTKAEQLGTTVISEDDLLEMLRTRPGSSSPADAAFNPSPLKSAGAKTAKKQVSPTSKSLHTKSSKRGALESNQSSSQASTSSSVLTQASTSSSVLTQELGSQELQGRDSSELMWVDKYKPASLKNIIGQQGDKSNARKLLHWLSNWVYNHAGNKKHAKPSPWAKDNDGAFFKAALLSGPPGVGKTTTAQLVCQELGFDSVELNASDTRSKRSLTEEVAQLLCNTSLSNFATGKSGLGTSRNHVLLMDEVDGMAGNEDRGGVQELIALLKTTKVPVICMCNDRQHPKIRSLANHCFDLRFYKPRVEQIRGAMMSVCFREGLKLKAEALDQIIVGSNQDVRQVLHHLSVFSAKHKSMDTEQTKRDAKLAKKDLKFNESSERRRSYHEPRKRRQFNVDGPGELTSRAGFGPRAVVWSGDRVALLRQLAKAANSIADGDLVERAIRSANNWSLLPTQALFSCVLPGEAMSGHLAGEIEFPAWLGNNSKKNKMDRLSSELLAHMRLKISGNKTDVALEYSREVLGTVLRPLLSGAEGVAHAVDAMASYGLSREDLDSLGEVAHWTGKPELFSKVDSKVKAAFTRTMNKSGAACLAHPVSKKKRAAVAQDMYGEDGEEELVSGDEGEEDDDLASDALIKVKKPSATATSKKVGGASSSGQSRRKK